MADRVVKYLHFEADGLRLVAATTAVIHSGADGGLTVRCSDGTLIKPTGVLGLVELEAADFASAPWLPSASSHFVDAMAVTPINGQRPWRVRAEELAA